MHETNTRVCRICKVERPADQFYRREAGKLRTECKECRIAHQRLKATGWCPDAYALAYAKQGGCCDICKTKLQSSRYTKLSGDHCHKTGKLRGLLCTSCNTALGLMKDSPHRLYAAIDYIKRHTHEDEEIVCSTEQSVAPE